MKILIVNTHHLSGGAAIAAIRLKTALLNMGQQPRMLVAAKQGTDLTTLDLRPSLRYKAGWALERMGIFLRQGFSKTHLWDIDPATHGIDITSLPQFREADIIHLHWVNQGMLSIKALRKILSSGKPVVWTMHDAWPFTGLCHSPLQCGAFRQQCGNCPLLRRSGTRDWSHRLWQQKQLLYSAAGQLTFVTCSHWLADIAQGSTLLRGHNVLSIPNPIDTHLFTPQDKAEARRGLGLPQDKHLILFSAYNVNAPIKGLPTLLEACRILTEGQPELRGRVAIVLAGRGWEQVNPLAAAGVELCPVGYVTSPRQMAQLYNAADLFCLPSLQENLPNTIMEAKACGVPTVATAVGGIPEMINHKTDGYLARPQDAADLAEGLRWVLSEADGATLRQLNRAAAVTTYGESRIAARYLTLYQQMLSR